MDIECNNSKKICDYLEKVNTRININKSSSLQTSEVFVNQLIKKLQPYHKEINGSIETFCDNKEQGLMLSLFNELTDDPCYIWACESKTDKSLMIVVSNQKTNQNLFMYDDKEKAQYFSKENFDEALEFCILKVDTFLGKDLNMKL